MIYEQRFVKGIQGKEDEFICRARAWLTIAQKCGARVTTGILQTIIGDTNEFSYILEYDDLAHREKVFKSIEEHRDMKMLKEALKKKGILFTVSQI